MNLKDLIMPALVVIFVILMIKSPLSFIDTVMHRPEVHVSYTTQQCVRVVTFGEGGREQEGSCYNLPERYDRVWVE